MKKIKRCDFGALVNFDDIGRALDRIENCSGYIPN